MSDRFRLTATVAAVVACCALARGAEAAYLARADWLAALPAQPSQTLLPFPGYSLVTQDAFGTTGPVQVNTSGQWTGQFGCDSRVFPCRGAYTATYLLPFAIIGYGGTLSYDFSQVGASPRIAGLDVPTGEDPARGLTFNDYNGFYGDFFAPTNVLTLSWPAGLRGTDDFTFFTLSSAQVVLAPVPEPSSLLLLGGVLGCARLLRRAIGASASACRWLSGRGPGAFRSCEQMHTG